MLDASRPMPAPQLSVHSIAILLDLVEIKLGSMEVDDSEDSREMGHLRRCRDELRAMDDVVRTLGPAKRRPGRPSKQLCASACL